MSAEPVLEVSPLDGETLGGLFLSKGAVMRDADGNWNLIGCACACCGARMFPRVSVCPRCMSEDVAEKNLPRTGTLYSYTVVRVGPDKWKKPTSVGYVDLDDGVRVFAHVRGDLAIGRRVSLAVDTVGQAPDGQPITNFVFITEDAR